MNPARKPRPSREDTRLLVVRGATEEISEHTSAALPALLKAGDLLVVNDAAALPAALRTEDGALEFRLTEPVRDSRARAIAFGAGDWRMRTEDRPAPPQLRRLDRLRFRGGLRAHLDSVSGREVVLHFDAPSSTLPVSLYAAAQPIQYSYLEQDLELWDVQTVYASRPWSVEAPSAGFALSFGTLKALLSAGIELARITHAAGISSTGDAALDQKLPLPEHYEVPADTVQAIKQTKARGGRVIAVGTTVVRALEGAAEANGGALVAGQGVTALKLSPSSKLRVVDGLLTGVHEPTEGHFALIGAFIPGPLQRRVVSAAEERGFLTHEFGDACLIIRT